MTRRLRLAPHDRRMQLLDCAGRIVLDLGLSRFTIDALAKEASVSVPLIYKYFDTRLDILQALLGRESERFNTELKAQLNRSSSYAELLRIFVTVNFADARSRNLLGVLYSQPDVRAGLEPAEFVWVRKVLVARTAEEFGLSKSLARQAVPMGSAASRAAAEQFGRLGGDRELAIDTVVKFILGAFRALGADTTD